MGNEDLDKLLPLHTNWLHILVSVASDPRHGYAIMQEVLERTGGKLQLWPTTLYRALNRMESAGLVRQRSGQGREEDERRINYAITRLGRAALRKELQRLEEFVALGHSRIQ